MSNDFGADAIEVLDQIRLDAARAQSGEWLDDELYKLQLALFKLQDQHKAAMRPLLKRIANLERYNAGLAQESCERRQRIEELESRADKPKMRTFSVSIPVSAIGETGNWNEIARALCDPLAQCVIEEIGVRIGDDY